MATGISEGLGRLQRRLVLRRCTALMQSLMQVLQPFLLETCTTLTTAVQCLPNVTANAGTVGFVGSACALCSFSGAS